MAYYPSIPVPSTQTVPTTTFYGLNRAMVVNEGEMEDMVNLTGDHFPIISTRPRRRTPEFPGAEGGGHVHCTEPEGMLGTDRLILCDDGRIYIDGVLFEGMELSTDASMQPKHMIPMGAYVCIWPDKVYMNLANPDDYGPMGAKWTPDEGDVISAMMTRKDGRDYDMEDVTISDTAPAEPMDKQLWLDTSSGVDQLKQYSAIYKEWIQVATTYIKIQATGIGKGFREGDVIFLSGVTEDAETVQTATEGGQETTSSTFTTDEFTMRSSFTTVHQGGTNYVSSTPDLAERTKVIKVTGIPDGAIVTDARLSFSAVRGEYGYKLLDVNSKKIQYGQNEIPVEVTGNGDVSLYFRYRSANNATVSGSHTGWVKIYDITLTVTWAATAATDEQTREQLDALNTSNYLYGCGDDYIIVAGLIRRNLTLAGTLKAELKIPDLDYITESNNRLWGCSYASADGVLTNEIRACALGDFRNWYLFEGTSMDSYVASIGSDGKFTGAATMRGTPLFFKEGFLHRISGTEPSNFALNTTVCRGVQEGSWRSLAMVGELLCYKSPMDVMAYDGSVPYPIGEKLGRERRYEAIGAAYLDKYYLSMRTQNMRRSLYVYDTVKQLWHKEDDGDVQLMANAGGVLYIVKNNELMSAGGQTGVYEEPFQWEAKFGVFGLTDPDQKYVSRFNIRANLAAGAEMTMLIQYDSDGVWHKMGTMHTAVTRTFLLPIVPRRCDHMQVIIRGKGDAKIYSVSRTYQRGGDGGYGPISRSADA